MVQFHKKIIKEGHGQTPLNKQEVYINFSFKYRDQDHVICKTHQPYRIILGRNDILLPLQQALKTMKQGQSSQITIPSNQISDDKFQKGKDLVAQVTIQSLGIVRNSINDYTFEERQKNAQIDKNEGNKLIKQKKYQQAVEKYLSAYKMIQFQTNDKCEQLKISLLSNLSLAYINIKEYEKSIQSCKKVLEECNNNIKIIYRRALSYKNLGLFQQALKDIKQGLKIDKNSAQLLNLQEDIIKHEKEAKKKQKAVYSKMFN